MSDVGGERMVKIDVRVPQALLRRVDDEYAERGYPSRSEAVRDALRDWVDPTVELSDETLDALRESRRQRAAGTTVPAEQVRKMLGVDDAGASPSE